MSNTTVSSSVDNLLCSINTSAMRDALELQRGIQVIDVDNSGNSDVTDSIQSALDDNNEGVVVLPSGTYLVSGTNSSATALRISSPIRLIMAPDAKLLLAPTAAASTSVLTIGAGNATLSDVVVEGGIIDGNALVNGSSYSTTGGGIVIDGPVSKVSIRDLKITNMLGAGLACKGASTNNRAKHISVENVGVDNCGEGVRVEKTDNFHMRGGWITDMKSQDCFEPHGAMQNWSLRDCYIARPHSSNSAVEVFPQHGDIVEGLIENCVIEDDEMRVSLSSGTSASHYEVSGLTVRGCHFKNSHAYLGVGGKFNNLTFDDNMFEGPSNCPRGVPSLKAAIDSYRSSNTLNVINNTIFNYAGPAVVSQNKNLNVTGNTIYNCCTNTGLSTANRITVSSTGGESLISNNNIYDDQSTATAIAGLAYNGARNRVIGNRFSGFAEPINLDGKATSDSIVRANSCPERYVDDFIIKTSASTAYAQISGTNLTGNPYRFALVTLQPRGDISPATRYWPTWSGAAWFINMDAAPASPVTFIAKLQLQDDYDR